MKASKSLLVSVAGIALACATAHAVNIRFEQINLVSDLPDVAQLQDPGLVNAWGISASPAGPFWVSANESGLSMVYTVTNDPFGDPQVVKSLLEVTIPNEGNVTGQAFNSLGGFNGDIFIFASEDGTISGWRPDLGTAAEVLVARDGANYKGITVAPSSHGPVILAANFAEGTVDEYDTNLTLLAQFVDTKAKAGYAPFNVQILEGIVFVTFAKQDGDDDEPGTGHGLIDILNLKNGKFTRFATGSDAGGKNRDLNSPWGLAAAPKGFVDSKEVLLVGNFGSGTVMIFGAEGDYKGLLKSADGGNVQIDGLWGLSFGNGGSAGVPRGLYFSAGPNGEGDGLFGQLKPAQGHGNNK